MASHKNHAPSASATEKLITILSIDGGGVRGIIPAIILDFLESELQKIDGRSVRIADYFDLIAGTSTGSLVTAMLTAPNKENRPLFAAEQIKPFYFNHCPKIFSHESSTFTQAIKGCKAHWFPKSDKKLKMIWNFFYESAVKIIGAFLFRPRYDGTYLHNSIKEMLGNIRLDHTLTNVFITAYDFNLLRPIFFSTSQAKKNASNAVYLSDAVISSAAAPFYLPPYYFETATTKYNVLDGGVMANNPTLLAIREATKLYGNQDSKSNPDYSRYLVLSLGTGAAKRKGYQVKDHEWGLFDWFVRGELTPPLLNVFFNAMNDMVDIYMSLIFKGHNRQRNYLRIQDDNLEDKETSTDDARLPNLRKLESIGQALLDKPASVTNMETGLQQPGYGGPTNRHALIEFAGRLSGERRRRLANCSRGY